MKGTKIFNSFMILAVFVTMSLPQRSLAVDFFGSSDREKASYYKGYNAGIARTLELNKIDVNSDGTVTNVNSTEVVNLQKQIDSLQSQIKVLATTPTTDLNTTGVYVTNPMSANLDVNDFNIFNSGSGEPVNFVSPVQINYEDETGLDVVSLQNTIRARATRQEGGDAIFGSGYVGVRGIANYPGGIGIYGQAYAGDLAGKFEGPVRMSDGGLVIDHGSLRVESASVDNPAIYANVMVNGATAIIASGNTENSTAIMGSSSVQGGTGIYGRGTYGNSVANNFAGKFDGNVLIQYGDLTLDRIRSNNEAIYFDTDVNLGASTLYGRNLNFTSMDSDQNLVMARAYGANSRAIYGAATGTSAFAGWFDGSVMVGKLSQLGDINPEADLVALGVTDTGRDYSAAIMAQTSNLGGKAGAFRAEGDDSLAIYANADGNNSFAAWLEGPVRMNNGGLVIDHGDLKVDSASGQNGILSTVLVQGGTAIRGVALADNSLAGAFVGNVDIDGDLKVSSGDLLLGYNDNYFITTSDSGWGGLYLSSKTDVGVVIDSNDDDPLSSFRVISDDSVDTMQPGSHDVFTVHSSGKVGINKAYPERTLDIYSPVENAEIDLKTGNQTHWAIYQDGSTGNMNFWHNNNVLTLTNRGIATNQICLQGQCVSTWRELKNFLDKEIPVDEEPFYPYNEVPQ